MVISCIFSEETIPCYLCHTIGPEKGGSCRKLKQMLDSKLDLIHGISPKKSEKQACPKALFGHQTHQIIRHTQDPHTQCAYNYSIHT